MRFLYTTAIFLYVFLIKIYALLGNKKAKKWVKGRHLWKENLKSKIKSGEKYICFHTSSLGEFEQARPLIEKIKEIYPSKKIVLSFFSPTGYEIRKNYEYADIVMYLPADIPSNVFYFIETINPVAIIFIKYEFWYNYINYIHKKNIPLYLVSAIFRQSHIFFKFYGKWFRKHLKFFTKIMVQDNFSKKILNKYGINNVTICGDTRFDRVKHISQNHSSGEKLKKVEAFCKNELTIVAGSTWPKDEKIILPAIKKLKNNFKFIIAPHNVEKKEIHKLIKKIKNHNINYALYSKSDTMISNKEILIIDCIGILSQIYKYAFISYVGGGFGSGIHNILEATVFNIPVIFGPNYKKFKEAIDMINLNVAFSIKNTHQFISIINKLLNDKELYKDLKVKIEKYFEKNIGATEKILKEIF